MVLQITLSARPFAQDKTHSEYVEVEVLEAIVHVTPSGIQTIVQPQTPNFAPMPYKVQNLWGIGRGGLRI